MLQWKYIAGNNWGICADGNGAVGCGDQEEFRACSDIAIGKGAASAIPTIKPPTKVKPTTEKWPTDNDNEVEVDENAPTTEDVQKPSSNLYGALIAMFTFFLVLCVLVAIYIYFYHGDFLKRLLRRQQNQQKTPLHIDSSASSVSSISSSPSEQPIRPPRTKRLTQTFKDMHNNHSSIMTATCKDDKNASDV